MAVKVKVKRLTLLAKLEEARDAKETEHAKALKKYENVRKAARKAALKDLREKCSQIDVEIAGEAEPKDCIYLSSDNKELRGTGGRRVRSVGVLLIESKVKFPERPELPYEHQYINRTIKMLDASDDEYVVVSDTDLGGYGIGSFASLDEEQR